MVIQAVEIAKAVLDRNEAILLRALEGLTVDELQVQVGPASNPIGWLMWHLSRVQDNTNLSNPFYLATRPCGCGFTSSPRPSRQWS